MCAGTWTFRCVFTPWGRWFGFRCRGFHWSLSTNNDQSQKETTNLEWWYTPRHMMEHRTTATHREWGSNTSMGQQLLWAKGARVLWLFCALLPHSVNLKADFKKVIERSWWTARGVLKNVGVILMLFFYCSAGSESSDLKAAYRFYLSRHLKEIQCPWTTQKRTWQYFINGSSSFWEQKNFSS